MQKHIKYAEFDIHADFARKELIHGRFALDIELGMKRAETRPNLAHHEVEPPAIRGLIRAQKESAAPEVIQFLRASWVQHIYEHRSYLGCPFPARKSSAFLPEPVCGGRAPSTLRMWAAPAAGQGTGQE